MLQSSSKLLLDMLIDQTQLNIDNNLALFPLFYIKYAGIQKWLFQECSYHRNLW